MWVALAICHALPTTDNEQARLALSAILVSSSIPIVPSSAAMNKQCDNDVITASLLG
jgi:hypothetical protein